MWTWPAQETYFKILKHLNYPKLFTSVNINSTIHEKETLHINHGSCTNDQAKVNKLQDFAVQKSVCTMFYHLIKSLDKTRLMYYTFSMNQEATIYTA